MTLSKKEFALLRALAAEPTRVFTREELLRGVWGFKTIGATRTLDSHAFRLRKKLNAAGDGFVVNVWGVGYRLARWRGRVIGSALAARPAGRSRRGGDGGDAAVAARARRAGEAVARACHELRGPLTAVSLGLALEPARHGDLPPARLRAIELELGTGGARARGPRAARGGGRGRGPTACRSPCETLLADSVEAWRPAAGARRGRAASRLVGPGALVRGRPAPGSRRRPGT